MYASGAKEKVLNLEKEYSPSQNTKRFQDHTNPSDKVIEHFIEVLKKDTDEARQRYNVRENVRYGKQDLNDCQVLDIFFDGNEENTPIFVYIHGGFWQALDKSSSGSFVKTLIENNNRVIVMDYNLCPNVTLKQLVEQMQDFFEWTFKYATATKASSISFCGHSAGAHLAASLLYSEKFQTFSESVKIHSFFLISGVYDLRELWNLDCVNPDNILSLDLAEATALSPICEHVKKDIAECCRKKNIKLHILVAENDSLTFIEQSRAYYKKLIEFGLPTEFKIFEKYDHFDIIEEAALKGTPINRYIIEHNCK